MPTVVDSLQLSLFMPTAAWVPPAGLPEYLLRSNETVAVDTETHDPLLMERGPSWRYNRGSIAGICLATKDRQWYFPIGHLGGGNLPKETVFDFFRDLLNNPDRTILMANAGYDLGWLWYEGILLNEPRYWGNIVDVILAEALICEEHPGGHSLDAISARRLKRRKDEKLLRQVAEELGLDPKKDLWKFPAKYVGQYGEMDARNTYDIFEDQKADIARDELELIWKLEMDLIPLIHLMTRTGIPINEEAAARLNAKLLKEELDLKKTLNFDPWSNDQVAKALLDEGFRLPKTERGNWSCDKHVLNSIADYNGEDVPLNLPARIMDYRKLNRLRATYVEDALKWASSGIVHPEYMQMASEGGGTRSGRMAAKNPNFQQIPKRSAIGKQIRQLYWTDDEDVMWGKFDYSSQEPRWQVHYGLVCGLEGAGDVRESFVAGKKLYTFMEENLPGVSYDDAKMLVLARSYGMGVKSLSETLNISMEDARDLLDKFDRGVPYISQLADMTRASAERKGYIRTHLGRRRRFLFWENPQRRDRPPVFGLNNAKERWPNEQLQRAYTNKAFNSLIQGSSADQTKLAMLNIWKETGMVPYCQVHDELDFPITNSGQVTRIINHMEQAIPDLKCPFKVDCDLGATWQ